MSAPVLETQVTFMFVLLTLVRYNQSRVGLVHFALPTPKNKQPKNKSYEKKKSQEEKKKAEEAKKKEEEAKKTYEEELEEQLTEEEITGFQIDKTDMDRLSNKVCEIVAEYETEGMFQSELWKKLKLSSRDGSRLALKL